jgi:hypothetical protein
MNVASVFPLALLISMALPMLKKRRIVAGRRIKKKNQTRPEL